MQKGKGPFRCVFPLKDLSYIYLILLASSSTAAQRARSSGTASTTWCVPCSLSPPHGFYVLSIPLGPRPDEAIQQRGGDGT